MRRFEKVLIANRGEIALRIIRACRELGLQTVAVYSEADRSSPHVLAADEAYPVGPAPPAQSYLRGQKLIELAARTGAGAIHPGYGFLAENAEFARACQEADQVFVGPPHFAMETLGDKSMARRLAAEAGVPVLPGSLTPLSSVAEATELTEEISYPVLLKAAGGGGGKGIRLIQSAEDLERAFQAASREAQKAFGDSRLYLERFLTGPRHVEVQILADQHGGVVHLGERECSIQRRYQKIIEESPSPAVNVALRDRLGEAAVAVARAARYENAGTVEFLLDEEGNFYFLEVNTRIQVEHPVTEMVTGCDLVQAQLTIAQGEALPWSQEEIEWRGAAIECRISSEDPAQGFLPATGRITGLELPQGPGVRVDGGIAVGQEITLHYDPLLAKIITWAADREGAITRMARALAETEIRGLQTNLPFLAAVMADPAFCSGEYSTKYLAEREGYLLPETGREEAVVAVLAAALCEERRRNGPLAIRGSDRATDPWLAAARQEATTRALRGGWEWGGP